MKAGILNQIAAHNIARYEEMSQVFRKDDEKRRHNHHNCTQVKLWLIKGRHGKPRGRRHFDEVDGTEAPGKNVAGNDTDKNRDNADKAASQDGCQKSDNQRKSRNDHGGFIAHTLCFTQITRHGHGKRSQFQPDNRDDGTHGGRRKENVDPVRSHFIDDQGKHHKGQSEDDKAPLGIAVIHTGNGADGQNRGNKSKARAQVSRQTALTNNEIQNRADTVHKKGRRRIHLQEKGYQYGRTEHGE